MCPVRKLNRIKWHLYYHHRRRNKYAAVTHTACNFYTTTKANKTNSLFDWAVALRANKNDHNCMHHYQKSVLCNHSSLLSVIDEWLIHLSERWLFQKSERKMWVIDLGFFSNCMHKIPFLVQIHTLSQMLEQATAHWKRRKHVEKYLIGRVRQNWLVEQEDAFIFNKEKWRNVLKKEKQWNMYYLC